MDAHTALLAHRRGLLTSDETIARLLLDAIADSGHAEDAHYVHNLLTGAGLTSTANAVDYEFRRRARMEG